MWESQIIFSDQITQNLGRAVCALGVFDGVHIGHRKIISDCIAHANEVGVKSIVFTFDVDPEEVFCHGSARKLLSNEDRIDMLSSLGTDIVLVQRFDKAFSSLLPHDFVKNVLESVLDPVGIHVGSNFRFGRGAKGDVEFLTQDLKGTSCVVAGEDLLESDGAPVTATRIRDMLESGDLAHANELLGRMHGFRGIVHKGRQVGRTMGFPTANVVPICDYVRMADGVYAGYVQVGGSQGQWHRASISVGVPKTFGDLESTTEAHLIDFDEDIYDQEVLVCFAEYLRPMIKFDSIDQLKAQIAKDTGTAADLPQI